MTQNQRTQKNNHRIQPAQVPQMRKGGWYDPGQLVLSGHIRIMIGRLGIHRLQLLDRPDEMEFEPIPLRGAREIQCLQVDQQRVLLDF